MKSCYYCGDKSVSVSHDVPVCKHHQPEEKPTEPHLTPATFWVDEEGYTLYPTD